VGDGTSKLRLVSLRLKYGVETFVPHRISEKPSPVYDRSNGDFMLKRVAAVWTVFALVGDAEGRMLFSRYWGEAGKDVGDRRSKPSVDDQMTRPVPWDPVDLLSDNNGDPLSNVEEVETESNDSEPRIGVFASEEVDEVLYVDVLRVISPPD